MESGCFDADTALENHQANFNQLQFYDERGWHQQGAQDSSSREREKHQNNN